MTLLTGRTALVTGASHGVGRAIAVAIAAAGADVVAHSLEQDDALAETIRLCQSHNVAARGVGGDLAGPTEACVRHVFDSAIAAAPGIDLLASNAGTYDEPPFLEMDYGTFERTMRLNLFSHFFLAQRFARRWVDRGVSGRMVFTGSINGRLAEPSHTAYDTSKGAVEMMVRSLCVALAPHGIRVNGMAPGLVYTPLTARAIDDPRFRRWMERHTPSGQVPGPDVCGEAVVFLLSDAARHIHGQMLLVDGGMSVWQQPDPPDEYGERRRRE